MSDHGTTRRYRGGCRCDACRAAKAEHAAKWRASNLEKVLAGNRLAGKKFRKNHPRSRGDENRKRKAKRLLIVRELKGTTCADCEGTFDPDKLHFHHVEGTEARSFKIAHWNKGLPGFYSVEALRAEAAKCVVLCHACHAARHRAMRVGVC